MKTSKIFLLLAVVFSLSACQTTTYNEKAIVGRWFSQEWLREGKPTGLTAWFEFNADKTYRAVIAQTQEQGTWWVEGYKLYTKAQGEEAIVVKIEKLDKNELVLGMNRGGQKEQLSFAPARK